MPKKDTIVFNFAKSKPMLNRFIASSSISSEEFAVLQTYFENPHLYSDIANSPFYDPEFLFGIRLTAPIDNIRYFILPCDEDEDEELLKFPINSKLITDNFQHESIFLDEQACVFLTPLDCEEKIKLVVPPNNQLYVVKSCRYDLDLESINPKLFPFPAIQYLDDIFQIMNYMGTDLSLFLQQHPHLSSTEKDTIARGIIAEVERLHHQNYIHSDIKACNFCIKENDLSICLIDYNEIIHENHVSFNQNSMGTFTSLGPEFFKKHIIEFVRDAKSLRQFEICIYYALTQIDKSFYPYFFQDRTKTYPFRSHSFFESQKSQALFASLSNIRAKSAEHFTRYELEQHILKYDWKHLFSKESDLYALACVLKFELKLKEDSLLFPIMQQMLHPEPTHRRIVHTL